MSVLKTDLSELKKDKIDFKNALMIDLVRSRIETKIDLDLQRRSVLLRPDLRVRLDLRIFLVLKVHRLLQVRVRDLFLPDLRRSRLKRRALRNELKTDGEIEKIRECASSNII